MDTTESENDIPQPVEKVDRRKIKRALWRTITLEDGTTKYDNRPSDPNYFKKYYDEKKKAKVSLIIACDRCQKQIAAGHILRHQRTKLCEKRYYEHQIKLLS